MKIRSLKAWQEEVELKEPFSISFSTEEAVDLHFVEISTSNGLKGYGSAKPSYHVTGESSESCAKALAESSSEVLTNTDVRHLPRLVRILEESLPGNPAARAALDMAFHDLLSKHLGVPLVDMLGRCHSSMTTSITIGIKDVPQTLEEAKKCLIDGFTVLKVKLGRNFEEDLEKLRKLREEIPNTTQIRVDPNQGYQVPELLKFIKETVDLDLEFVEQPLPADDVEQTRQLPDEIRRRLAADESLHHPEDALNLLTPQPACGIFNIKLMKCGGILRGRQIASIAEAVSIPLMWGCNNESRLSLSAALHAAFSCPNTRFLDLDGDLDLVRDPAKGGYQIKNGMMTIDDTPGLGVTLNLT